ncbi:S4 domain-containing protein, partial [Oenococcus oeni]
FLNREEIEELADKVKNEPEKREAQRRLAEEVTKFVHGQTAVEEAEKISRILFNGDVENLTASQVAVAFSGVPTIEVADQKTDVVELLVKDKVIEKSRRQAREDLKNGAITINGEKISNVNGVIDPTEKFDGRFIIIRRGKKKYFLAKVQ